MRGVGEEAPVPLVTLVEAIERGIDGLDQRRDLDRHLVERQLHAALVDVDAFGLRCDMGEALHGPAHHERGCNQGRQRHQHHDRQDHVEEQQRRAFQRAPHRELAIGASHNLDPSRRGVDPFDETRGSHRFRGIPFEPRLAHMIEARCDRRELRGHRAFGELVTFGVADDEPEVGVLGAQGGQFRRLAQHQPARCIAGDGVSQPIEGAALILADQEPRPQQPDRGGPDQQDQQGQCDCLQAREASHQAPGERAWSQHAHGVSRST